MIFRFYISFDNHRLSSVKNNQIINTILTYKVIVKIFFTVNYFHFFNFKTRLKDNIYVRQIAAERLFFKNYHFYNSTSLRIPSYTSPTKSQWEKMPNRIVTCCSHEKVLLYLSLLCLIANLLNSSL